LNLSPELIIKNELFPISIVYKSVSKIFLNQIKTILMKKLIIIAFCLVTLGLSAQNKRPEKVLSFVDVTWKSDKYESLEKQWKKVVEKDKKDAEAWENYYLAAMYKYKASMFYRDSTIKGSREELHKIILEMGKYIPNTYEYNKLMFRDHDLDPKYGNYIVKAYEINPNRIDLYPLLITYYETIRDSVKKAEAYQKWYSIDKSFEEYKLSYGYNMLMSVEKNAIILSSGDNQFYPVGMIRYGKNIRNDVDIVAQSMFFANTYYSNLMKSLGMPPFNKTIEDYKKEYPDDFRKAYKTLALDLIQHIIDHAGNRPVYFPIGMRDYIINHFKDSLYMVGVLYQYSPAPFDNYAILKKNFEQKYYLDNLRIDLKPVPDNSGKYRLQTIYLTPLAELYKHYLLSGSITEAHRTKELILKIADDYGIKDNYLEYLNELEEKLNN